MRLIMILCLLCAIPQVASAPGNTFILWQLPEQTHSQMMSYVIQTPNGKIIVIDGGVAGDAPYLKGFLAALGNRIDYWFISHLHNDHIGAITEILKNPGDLRIGRMYASMHDAEWIKKTIPPAEHEAIAQFEAALDNAGKEVISFRFGGKMDIAGVHIEVLGVQNPEFPLNQPNNSSVVLRVWDSFKSILFLGDLGPEGGEKLLKGKYRDRLQADYVQMAHHGQNGVNQNVYEAIAPKYCLWPTPRWLWENNPGQGVGTGPWKTLEVRKWMEEIGVKKNYVSADGLCRID